MDLTKHYFLRLILSSYFFNEKHPARGFSSDFKEKPGPLKGNLIFKDGKVAG